MKPAIEQIRDLTAALATATEGLAAAESRAVSAESALAKATESVAAFEVSTKELAAKITAFEAENARLKDAVKAAEESASQKAVDLVATRIGVDLSKSPDAAAAKSDEKPKPTGRALIEASIAESINRLGVKFN